MSFAIRRGGPNDREFVLDLGRRSVGDSISSVRPAPRSDVVVSYERLIAYLDHQSHVVFIAHSSFEPLGFLVLLDRLPDEVTGGPQAFVVYMAVEAHARRRGVGRALLDHAEAFARAQGLPFVSMMVTEDNAAARALYASVGYATERRLLTKAL